jgi:hypothetical protein
MATNIVRKGSVYSNGVVSKTKTGLYFYTMWYRISYNQNYFSIPTSIKPPFHYNISIRKALKLCPSMEIWN